MKNLILFGLFVLFLVAVQFANGKTVDEIIEKHLRARGGFDKLDAIKSMYMEGIIKMMGNVGFVKIYKVQNKLNRTRFDMQWQITDEEGHSFASIHSPTQSKLISEAVAGIETEPDITAPLINYVAKGHTAILIGKDVIEENTCYKIRLTTKAGREINYWINASNWLLIQVSFKNSETGTPQDAGIRTIYNNYKVAEGILFAHTIEMIMTGLNENAPIEISFNKIEINQPVEAKFLNQYNQS